MTGTGPASAPALCFYAAAMDGVDALLALARTPGLHADLLPAESPFRSNPASLAGASATLLRGLGLDEAKTRWLASPDAAVIAADRHWLERSAVQLLPFGAAEFPPLLTHCPSAPLVLFVRGAVRRLLQPQLAMVGSRRATAGGLRTAFDFAARFAELGLTITSGLALGIDAASHEGALSTGHTIAVVGTGLDQTYPPENQELAERIVAGGGALVSEFPPGTPPLPLNFPRRNRLISGLAKGTLVVEAAHHSGSLITARLAGQQGRDVFAIPGSIHNPQSRGCHRLLRDGARLVESIEDVLQELHFPLFNQSVDSGPGSLEPGEQGFGELDKDHKILLDALGFEPVSVDFLVERTGLSSQSLATLLLILELEGRVGLHPGGRYARLK